jgi:hypothetical protein
LLPIERGILVYFDLDRDFDDKLFSLRCGIPETYSYDGLKRKTQIAETTGSVIRSLIA